MLSTSNVFVTFFHEFIKKISKDGIAKIPSENVSDLNQKMNDVYERLYEAKALPRKNTVQVLTVLNSCSVHEFLGPSELILHAERVRQMESDGDIVNNKKNLEKVKYITLMVKNSFHSLNVPNTCSIPIIHKRILGP